MPKQINISLKESEKELCSRLRKAKSERERLRALILLKEGKVVYQSQLAQKLGFTEKTVREWLKPYNEYGLSESITIKVGGNNARVISDKVIDFIASQLTNSQTTVTYNFEIQDLIDSNFNEATDYGTLYAHCRRRHKSKLKVSSHYKKDSKADEVFKKP